jgi:predicted MPP superfamily phosphohydrolase
MKARNESKIRIGWLSDIHYQASYANKNDVQQMLSLLGEVLKKAKVNYVVLNGDVCFSGDVKEYTAFLKVIEKHLPPCPILTIPGNHDVHWISLTNALRAKKYDLPDLFKVRPEEITAGNSPFLQVFGNYEWFEGQLREKRSYPSHVRASEPSALGCGYLYDSKANMLFLQLNSSWYSFGEGVIAAAYEDFKEKKLKDVGSKGLPSELFALFGEKLSQLGQQSYFLEQYPYWKTLEDEIIKKYDPIVITLAHHPPSWLKWNEVYSKTPSKWDFNYLLNTSHLLLTGHVHSPYIQCNVIENTCVQLGNGCLLDYHWISEELKAEVQFKDSIFGILTVDRTGVEYEQYSLKTEGALSWESVRKKAIQFIQNTAPSPASRVSGKVNVKEIEFRDTDEFIELLDRTRGIRLKAKNSEVIKDHWYVFQGKSEKYIACFSSLPEVPLKEDFWDTDFFKPLARLLNEGGEKGTVVGFYELVELPKFEDDEAESAFQLQFQAFQRQRFAVYQMFKHGFFRFFPTASRLKELAIVYDCLLK